MRVAKACIAHSRSIDQGCDFSEVLSAKLVEDVDVRISELREELDIITRLTSFIPQPQVSRWGLTMYFSSGEVLERNCSKERLKWVPSS